MSDVAGELTGYGLLTLGIALLDFVCNFRLLEYLNIKFRETDITRIDQIAAPFYLATQKKIGEADVSLG